MNVFIIIFMLLIFGICIFNYIREKRIESILESIQDKEIQRNIVYQKMLDEYVKMLSAIDLNNHCMNSINDEYIILSKKIDKLSSKEQMQVEIDTKAILDSMDITKWINKEENSINEH